MMQQERHLIKVQESLDLDIRVDQLSKRKLEAGIHCHIDFRVGLWEKNHLNSVLAV